MKHPIGILMAIAAAAPFHLNAQQRDPAHAPAFAAIDACVSYVEAPGGPAEEGKAAGVTAEKLFRELVKANPKSADAHFGIASAISRCQIPYAGMTTILGLVEESVGEAEAALALDSKHWGARYILAMNYFHMPSFLGKTNDAIAQLEILVAQQGSATSPAHYAEPYVYLGEAYERAGRSADAARVWKAGLALFPSNEALKKHVSELKGADAASASASTSGASTTASPSPVARNDMPAIVALEPLRVEVAAQQLDDARSGTALRRMDVYLMPGGTGEMMQALQAMPGVTRASEGADMYVRGGDPAETPVFVDGGRIAFPGRWETLNGPVMGVLEASILSKAYFSAGGFSARYGDALSGVVDVETRGRPEEATWRAGVNFVQAGASMFAPISDKAGAWLTGAVTDTRLVSSMNGQSDVYPDAPKSLHVIGGGSLAPARGVELRAMGIAMRDMATRTVNAGSYRGDFESDGTTLHTALSGRALRADGRVGVEASIAGSQRETGFAIGVLDRNRTDRSLNGRVDVEYAGDHTRVRSGLELASLDAAMSGHVPTTSNIAPGSPFTVLNESLNATSHVGGYVEAEHVPVAGLSLVAGVRADQLPGENSVTVDPRLAAGYTTGSWTLRVGAGIYHQGSWRRAYHLPEAGAPGGTPREARHLIVGAERAGEPSVRVEAYRKAYSSYVAAGEGPQIESGNASGVDMIVRWSKQQKLNGWITYSLLDASIGMQDGSTTRAPYDVTHTLTAVGRYAITEDWELGSTLRYATGKPFTPVIGGIAGTDGAPATPVYGDVQSARLPRLERLDARVSRYIRGEKSFALVYVEMLNLLDRQNVMSYSYDPSWTQRAPVDAFFAHRTFVLGAEISH